MKKIYTLKCIGGFRDGNVYPRFINNGEILEDVDERLFHRFTQSDPEGFEVVEVKNIVPPPTKSKSKKQQKEEAVVEKTPEEEGTPDGTEG